MRWSARNIRVTSRNGRCHFALSSVRGVTCRHVRRHRRRVCRQSGVVHVPYQKREGLLYREGKLCVPEGAFRKRLLYDYHDVPSAGHLGPKKTYLRLKDKYYWKGMSTTVQLYVTSCNECQRTKSKTTKPQGLLQPLKPPEQKWSSITMDFITPLPKTKSGHSAILVVVDRLSKQLHFIPTTQDVNAQETAKLFKDNIYRHHGIPDTIISDRDKIFTSMFWKELFRLLGTKLRPSSAYHPQTDGQTEVMNKKLEEMIRAFVNYDQDNWTDHLVEFEVAYNSSVNATTSFTPFFLSYGYEPRFTPIENTSSTNPTASTQIQTLKHALSRAQTNIRKSNEYAATYANKKRTPCTMKLNDLVMLSTKNLNLDNASSRNKLNPKYCGPFRITEQINPVTFRLALSQPLKSRGVHNAFHSSLLVPYKPDLFKRIPKPPVPLLFDDGHEEYEIERILTHRRRRGRLQYLVQWKGYADHENSWDNKNDLENAQELLSNYAQYPLH